MRNPWLAVLTGFEIISFALLAGYFSVSGNQEWTVRDRFSLVAFLMPVLASLTALLMILYLKKKDELQTSEKYYLQQKNSYRSLELSSRVLTGIRHDLNNIQAALISLIEQEQFDAARRILNDFSRRISETEAAEAADGNPAGGKFSAPGSDRKG